MKQHPNRTRRTVVGNVNAELGRRRVTQRTMAEWLGISQAAASDRVKGKTPFTLDELDVLADRLGVPVGVLVSEPTHYRPLPGGLVTAGADRPVTHQNHTPGIVTAWNVAGRGEFGLAA